MIIEFKKRLFVGIIGMILAITGFAFDLSEMSDFGISIQIDSNLILHTLNGMAFLLSIVILLVSARKLSCLIFCRSGEFKYLKITKYMALMIATMAIIYLTIGRF